MKDAVWDFVGPAYAIKQIVPRIDFSCHSDVIGFLQMIDQTLCKFIGTGTLNASPVHRPMNGTAVLPLPILVAIGDQKKPASSNYFETSYLD
jgi:hypothetical protein